MAIETSGYINTGTDGNHIVGSGGTPTVVLGPGAGAGSAIITGNDNSFKITLTAGAGTASNAIVFTITFNSAFTAIPQSIFSPSNANASANTSRLWVNNLTTTTMTLNITNPALTAGQVYIWNFINI